MPSNQILVSAKVDETANSERYLIDSGVVISEFVEENLHANPGKVRVMLNGSEVEDFETELHEGDSIVLCAKSYASGM